MKLTILISCDPKTNKKLRKIVKFRHEKSSVILQFIDEKNFDCSNKKFIYFKQGFLKKKTVNRISKVFKKSDYLKTN